MDALTIFNCLPVPMDIAALIFKFIDAIISDKIRSDANWAGELPKDSISINPTAETSFWINEIVLADSIHLKPVHLVDIPNRHTRHRWVLRFSRIQNNEIWHHHIMLSPCEVGHNGPLGQLIFRALDAGGGKTFLSLW